MDGDGEPLAEVVYVDLRELEGSEELTGFSAERKSLLLAPRMYWDPAVHGRPRAAR